MVKPCGQVIRKITLLLNRRSVQTFEQLIADISEALGFPRWKNDRVRKLYNLKGREIRSVSDFFREGDAFIAMGKEQLTLKNLEMAIQELYPDNPYAPPTETHRNWEQPQKPKNRLHEKTSKVENVLEPVSVKNCIDAVSPKLINRHAQTKVKPEEKVRTKKKWIRDNWNGEQDMKHRKAREVERYFNQEKCPRSEAEKNMDIVRCEKCQRERQLRQKLQKARQVDIPFEGRDLNMRMCQRYNVERSLKLKNCRKLSESSAEEGESTWSDAVCQSTWTTSHSNANEEPERQKRSAEREQTLESHEENHDKELRRMKVKPIESQRTIVGVAYELKKEHRKCSRVNQSCWLIKGSQVDTERTSNIQGKRDEVRKPKEEATGGEAKVEHAEVGLTKHEGEPKANKEEVLRTYRTSETRPRRDIHSRADVESFYEIGRNIGDGNFAVVMQCHHRSSNMNYAMKIIDKSKLKGKEDMLENEILIIKSLSHPNIVSLIEVFETDAEIYLILEYVPDGDLFDAIIESVKFTERDAALMITDLGEALVYIHSRNIVHRDLKPENLLVST